MKKEVIMKKLHNINNWVQEARERKDWKTYEAAVAEYTRLTKLLKVDLQDKLTRNRRSVHRNAV